MFKIVESNDGFKWAVREEHRFGPIPGTSGLKVNHDYSGKTLGEGRRFTFDFMYKHAHPDTIFVDVGACVGRFTVRLAKRVKQVIAIEPIPYNIIALKENLRINHIDNVTILNCAVSDVAGKLKLNVAGGWTTALNQARAYEMEVDALPLDDLVDCAHLIKVDTEGWEGHVVKGSEQLVKKCRPVWLIEAHDRTRYGRRHIIAEEYWYHIGRVLHNYKRFAVGPRGPMDFEWGFVPLETKI